MHAVVAMKYRDDCVALDLDTGETILLPVSAVTGLSIHVGSTISREGYDMIKEESRRFQCKRAAFDYLAIRPRTVSEMERYLTRKGFDAGMIRDAVDELTRSGYLNDADYAARYIGARLRKKLVGKHLLAAELQRRGVSLQVIRHALKGAGAQMAAIDEVYDLALKKYNSLGRAKNRVTKIASFLRGRGFDFDTITAVVERLRSEIGHEEDA